MYVCICNALNESAVRTALESGGPGTSVAGIYRQLGCTPKCGRCVEGMRSYLDAAGCGSAPLKLAAD